MAVFDEKLEHIIPGERLNEVLKKRGMKVGDEVHKYVDQISPEKKYTFSLNAHSSIANAIRRCAISETENKALIFDVEDYKTSTPHAQSLVFDVLNRISMIHIDQNIPDDTVLTLDVKNNTEKFRPIYSSELKSKYFNQNVHICTLNPYESIRINNIHVVKGSFHARFQVPVGFTYTTLDYIPVDYMFDRKVINKVLVKASDMAKYKDKKVLIDNTGLVMVDIVNDVGDVYKVYVREKDLKFPADQVIVNISDYEFPADSQYARKKNIKTEFFHYLEQNYDDYDVVLKDNIPFYSTTEISPQIYQLSFIFLDFIDHIKYMNYVVDTLKWKIKKIMDKQYRLDVRDDVHEFTIIGETTTIGELVISHVYEMKPSISNVNYKLTHILSQEIKIIIVDTAAVQLFHESLIKIMKKLDNIKFK